MNQLIKRHELRGREGRELRRLRLVNVPGVMTPALVATHASCVIGVYQVQKC
jgi:hypothetical protein